VWLKAKDFPSCSKGGGSSGQWLGGISRVMTVGVGWSRLGLLSTSAHDSLRFGSSIPPHLLGFFPSILLMEPQPRLKLPWMPKWLPGTGATG
jgi:hypothetical protein